jgi:hypothetical protein
VSDYPYTRASESGAKSVRVLQSHRARLLDRSKCISAEKPLAPIAMGLFVVTWRSHWLWVSAFGLLDR